MLSIDACVAESSRFELSGPVVRRRGLSHPDSREKLVELAKNRQNSRFPGPCPAAESRAHARFRAVLRRMHAQYRTLAGEALSIRTFGRLQHRRPLGKAGWAATGLSRRRGVT